MKYKCRVMILVGLVILFSKGGIMLDASNTDKLGNANYKGDMFSKLANKKIYFAHQSVGDSMPAR